MDCNGTKGATNNQKVGRIKLDNHEECLKPAKHVPTSSLSASHLAPQPPVQHQRSPILTTTLSQHKEIPTDASKTSKRLSPQAEPCTCLAQDSSRITQTVGTSPTCSSHVEKHEPSSNQSQSLRADKPACTTTTPISSKNEPKAQISITHQEEKCLDNAQLGIENALVPPRE